MAFEPAVKWSGSKRSQAEVIVKRMPREIGTYYEPFLGGASVLRRLMGTPSVHVERFCASDANEHLIALWVMIKQTPDVLADAYGAMWRKFNAKGDDTEWRTSVYNDVRARFNAEHSPTDFFFVMRTTANGMPRFNSAGEFNNGCHFTRPGIEPERVRAVLREWSALLSRNRVEFSVRSYETVMPSDGDFTYLDPPYAFVKGHSMYNGGIDLDAYFKWLRGVRGKWIMSFDGKVRNADRGEEEDKTYSVPYDLFEHHEYIDSGNSSFRRMHRIAKHCNVFESLYANYRPEIGEMKQMELF